LVPSAVFVWCSAAAVAGAELSSLPQQQSPAEALWTANAATIVEAKNNLNMS
jgi:hypothetical protein